MRPPTIWMSTILYAEKLETNLFFMLLLFHIPCNLIFYVSAAMNWDIMVPQDYTISLQEIITRKSYVKIVINKCAPAQNVKK